MATDRQRKCEVQIPAGQVGAGGTTNGFVLLSAPVFITNASEFIDLDHADAPQSDGGDVQASSDSAGSTQLGVHIIRWNLNNNPALSEILIAVGPISLSSSSTNSIWLWWGHVTNQNQPAVGASFGQYSVYRSGFTGVYGCDLGSGNTLHDYTSNARNGTSGAGSWASVANSKLGRAVDGGYAWGTGVSLSSFMSGAGATGTQMGWIYPTGTANAVSAGESYNGQPAWAEGGGYWGMYRADDGGGDQIKAFVWSGGAEISVAVATAVDTWMFVAMKQVSGQIYILLNGGSYAGTFCSGPDSASDSMKIGGGFSDTWDGRLDQIVFSNEGLSEAETVTYYNNTNAPGTFATAQTPAAGGGGGAAGGHPAMRRFGREPIGQEGVRIY